jgi:hypothetical protein
MLLCSLACAASQKDDDPTEEDTTPAEREGDDAGECEDGADNDVDGNFDCDDSDCAGSPVCDDGDETDTADSGGSGCGLVITEFRAEPYDGLLDLESGPTPAMDLYFSATDDDSLSGVTAWWWRDERADGTVDVSEGEAYEFSDADGVTLRIAVGSDRLAYETEYEFGLQLVDTTGCASDVAIAVGTTPDASGH